MTAPAPPPEAPRLDSGVNRGIQRAEAREVFAKGLFLIGLIVAGMVGLSLSSWAWFGGLAVAALIGAVIYQYR